MTRGHYKLLAERRLRTIKQLTEQLKAEKWLNATLSKMEFRPLEKQNPAKLKQLRRATTIRNQKAA